MEKKNNLKKQERLLTYVNICLAFMIQFRNFWVNIIRYLKAAVDNLSKSTKYYKLLKFYLITGMIAVKIFILKANASKLYYCC